MGDCKGGPECGLVVFGSVGMTAGKTGFPTTDQGVWLLFVVFGWVGMTAGKTGCPTTDQGVRLLFVVFGSVGMTAGKTGCPTRTNRGVVVGSWFVVDWDRGVTMGGCE
jgi:hypothetical protein